MYFVTIDDFDEWRQAARRLLAANIPPQDVHWTAPGDTQSLFAAELPSAKDPATRKVSPEFLRLARQVACHRHAVRWTLLYRVLWRLTHGERHLLELSSDSDVRQLVVMQKDVARDIHKMHAFVRFRKVTSAAGEEHFIAWHRPDHRILPLAAPFFARRFVAMNWSIMTPDASVSWDQMQLRFGPGVPASAAPADDAMEELWRAYYASIFNPARVNIAQMKREMPIRHWPTLPETTIIPKLLEQAESRVKTMLGTSEGLAESAVSFLPPQRDLSSLAAAVKYCTACDLYCHATQPVFGEGSATARVMLVGEQPGDREDSEGRPFVGPAGQLLDSILERVGIERRDLYVTNVVKHFKFQPRGKFRLHQKPNAREMAACRPWMEAEIDAVRPKVLVCLGATAAQALIGRDFRITQQRGQFVATAWCQQTIATWHPAAILRMVDEFRRAEMEDELVGDLKLALGNASR